MLKVPWLTLAMDPRVKSVRWLLRQSTGVNGNAFARRAVDASHDGSPSALMGQIELIAEERLSGSS